jgi:hypothetical protein|tara:strand:+ start:1016 stop:1306 length:291 start_codon:yes stop_codon:yes gene_type:complete
MVKLSPGLGVFLKGLKMSKSGYDIVYRSKDEAYLEPHFCREWEGDCGCYGTNEMHGFTFEEAKEELAKHYEAKAKWIRESAQLSYWVTDLSEFEGS